MSHPHLAPEHLSIQRLYQAGAEFFFLQNHLYPRPAALQWVGNRHHLIEFQRNLLNRGVFSQQAALRRRAKRCRGSAWQKETLLIDGHNVHITVESALLGRPLVLGNDGALRDLAGQSARFRFAEIGEMALDAILFFLFEFRPAEALFFFDAPISRSGYMADRYRQRMKGLGLAGEAKAVPVPEREFSGRDGVIASSDRAVLDEATQWLDLARWVIDRTLSWQPVADFSNLIYSNSSAEKASFSSGMW
ncbi:MAG: DUF434 domain-containing protein [Desulforhabdus sp.]|jgi:hypothetical protein|nr:DUF434 domain-containing protein [Desulforhabdus sp.]